MRSGVRVIIIRLASFFPYSRQLLIVHTCPGLMPSLVAKPRQSRLIETAVEFLSTCVIFRRPDVDEHSTLLKCIYAIIEYARKKILLESSEPLRNIFVNGRAIYVLTSIY